MLTSEVDVTLIKVLLSRGRGSRACFDQTVAGRPRLKAPTFGQDETQLIRRGLRKSTTFLDLSII